MKTSLERGEPPLLLFSKGLIRKQGFLGGGANNGVASVALVPTVKVDAEEVATVGVDKAAKVPPLLANRT